MRFDAHIRVCLIAIAFAAGVASAEAQPAPPAISNALMRMIASQPSIDTKSPVVASAWFDPPQVRPGERSVYRITFNALEASVRLPDRLPEPDGLKLRASAHGQVFHHGPNVLKPATTFVFDARADQPGRYVVPSFIAAVNGEPLAIAETVLEVRTELPASHPPARQLLLECETTNVFAGQQINVRVLSPSWSSNFVQFLTQVEFSGDAFLANKTAARQSIESITHDGRKVPAYIYETTVTPIAAGQMPLSVQAFTAGRQSGGPVTIHGSVIIPGGSPEYLLLDSEPVTLNIQPLPAAGELPGFTGAIGSYACDLPRLGTNTVRVGDPLQLSVTIRGTGDLNRLTPPPLPQAKGWQVFPATLEGIAPPTAHTPAGAVFKYTLIPLTDELRETPAIPFSYFDAYRATYLDRTIPSVPVVVVAEGLPTSIPAALQLPDKESKTASRPSLSDLSPKVGHVTGTFVPLPLRGWFLAVQLLPAFGFLGLLLWDQRRRYFAAHPDIVRCRAARRQLRRQKRLLTRAAAGNDALTYARSAVTALQIGCAPHYPAEPQALVCADVLNVLDVPERNGRPGEVVRKFFAAADDSRFAVSPRTPGEVLGLKSELEGILARLEERL